LQLLDELGLLNPAMLAVHMTQLTEAEISLLAKKGVNVVHCPESNMKLASGGCEVNKLLKAGINVALGTDGAASNNDLDMIGEMRSAALLGKHISADASALNATQTLRMATINGAHALAMRDITGSLEIGKSADIIAVDTASASMSPVYDPTSHLVYSASRDCVNHVWVAGKQLLKEKQLTTLNEKEILRNAKIWQQKISHHSTEQAS
jgi:5-methylthioadenosine/S-adenosylhomocysteine deaminase